jgi:hypothetical protein
MTTSSTSSTIGKNLSFYWPSPTLNSQTPLLNPPKSYALGGKAYTIHFFLGNPPSGEVSTYSRAPNHVGCVYTFSSQVEQTASASAGCRNCAEQKKKGVLSTAQVPITSALLSVAKNPDIPQIQSLEPEGVENYLTTNLHWRAVEVRLLPVSSSLYVLLSLKCKL